jgi:hypothetical protein
VQDTTEDWVFEFGFVLGERGDCCEEGTITHEALLDVVARHRYGKHRGCSCALSGFDNLGHTAPSMHHLTLSRAQFQETVRINEGASLLTHTKVVPHVLIGIAPLTHGVALQLGTFC